ncbi:MAG: hypothetical protein HY842_02055 [Bacteroidetes bacterium]|nr:hypothetical protein [Bacteroidota bacterium]
MDDPGLTKQRLFSKLYGKTEYNDLKMRKLMTRLTQLLEQYMVLKELEKSNDSFAHLLVRSLGDRSDYDLFKEAAEGRIGVLEALPERGKGYFRERYRLFEMLFYHPETAKLSKNHDYFQHYISDFEYYFTLGSLQRACDNLVRKRLLQTDSNLLYLATIDEVASDSVLIGFPVVYFFHHLFRLFNNLPVEDDLLLLQELCTRCLYQMSRDEQSLAVNLLVNYAAPKSNEGSKAHTRFIFEIYKITIENELLLHGKNALSAGVFMNIVAIGLLVKELAWTQHFMAKYGDLMHESEREMTLQYCEGLWCYHNGLATGKVEDFYNAIQALNLVPIRAGAKFELRLRPLLVRVKFELFARDRETLDEFISHIRNFERHLQGNADYTENVKKSNLNFAHKVKTLARLKNEPVIDLTATRKLLKSIEETANCILKSWLLEKAKELIVD